ncbi:MAG TPA: disulfide bond formation protein B [Caulobacteraceae bacterium]
MARQWLWVALIFCAAMLAIAHAFETFGHLSPCELCLKQRDVYWLGLGLGVVGLAWKRFAGRFDPTRPIALIFIAVFAAEAGIAAYHAGVEWKFWPGPASCSGGATHVDPAALRRLLSGAKMGLPACDRPAWVWLGLSMAGWNAVAAAVMAVGSLIAAIAWRDQRGRR